MDITSYWKILNTGCLLNRTYLAGMETQAAHLRDEGYTVELGSDYKPLKINDFNNL